MGFSTIIFAVIVLFMFLILATVLASFFLSPGEIEKKHVNGSSRSQREHNTKVIRDTIEKSSIHEKIHGKISTSENTFHPEVENGEEEEVKIEILRRRSPEEREKVKVNHSTIPKMKEKEKEVEVKEKLNVKVNQPPPSNIPKKKEKEIEKKKEAVEAEEKRKWMRGTFPTELLGSYQKEKKVEEKKEEEKKVVEVETEKRLILKKEIQERKEEEASVPSVYKDPTEGVCIHTRANCLSNSSSCFLGAGHLDLNECLKKGERIQENIDRHNERFPSADTRRKSDVKYISWAPANNYPDMHEPQCMIFGEEAEVLTNEAGWKTYVKNPTSFTMTQNPSVYLVEGKCPTVKMD